MSVVIRQGLGGVVNLHMFFNEFVSSCSETRFDWDFVDLPEINQYLLSSPMTKTKEHLCE